MFRDREDAAHQLADKLKDRDLLDPLILAIPRGGVVTGAVLASELGAELDVVLSRKFHAPRPARARDRCDRRRWTSLPQPPCGGIPRFDQRVSRCRIQTPTRRDRQATETLSREKTPSKYCGAISDRHRRRYRHWIDDDCSPENGQGT